MAGLGLPVGIIVSKGDGGCQEAGFRQGNRVVNWAHYWYPYGWYYAQRYYAQICRRFETGLGETGKSLVIDAAQFSVGGAETLRISDKSGHFGHLSVEPGAFCPLLSGLCPVLSQECPGFVRPGTPGNGTGGFRCGSFSCLILYHLRRECGCAGELPGNPLPNDIKPNDINTIEIW